MAERLHPVIGFVPDLNRSSQDPHVGTAYLEGFVPGDEIDPEWLDPETMTYVHGYRGEETAVKQRCQPDGKLAIRPAIIVNVEPNYILPSRVSEDVPEE